MLRIGVLWVLLLLAVPGWAVRQDLATPANVDTVTVKVDATTGQVVFSVGTSPSVATPTTRTVFAAGWSTGIVVNDASRAAGDFRVESDNGDSALFVDSGGDSLFSEIRLHLRRRTIIDSLAIGHSTIAIGWAGGSSASVGAAGRLRFGTLIYADSLRSDSVTTELLTTLGATILGNAAADAVSIRGTLQDSARVEEDSWIGTAGNDTRIVFDGSGNIILLTNGLAILGDGTTTTHAGMTYGVYVDQRATDNLVFGAGSSDVAHGLTSGAGSTLPTSQFFGLLKNSDVAGGLQILTVGENAAFDQVLSINTYGGQATTTQTTAAVGLVNFFTSQHDGANGLAAATNNGVMYSFRGRNNTPANVTLFMLDEDGDFLYDGADGGAFALFNDPGILYALERETARPGEMVLRAGERWLEYQREDLMRLGVLSQITPEEEAQGHRPLINGSVLDKVHTGGIIQNTAAIDLLTVEVDSLKTINTHLRQRVAALEFSASTAGPMIFDRSN